MDIPLKQFDTDYDKKEKLSIFQAHGAWMCNPYKKGVSEDGIINFGTSVNAVIPKKTVEYLPNYIKQEDCAYPDPLGRDPEFNSHFCEGTQFTQEYTLIFNNLACVASIFFNHYQNVYIKGQYQLNSIILDHSKGKSVQVQKASAIATYFLSTQQNIKISKEYPEIPKLFILKNRDDLKHFQGIPKLALSYTHSLRQPIQFAVVHSKDADIKLVYVYEWNFFPPSNVVRKASLTPNASLDVVDSSTTNIRKMIEVDSGVQVPSDKIWVTLGAASALDHISRAIFNGGNLCLDSPYYVGFDHDFKHSNVQIVHKSMFAKTTPLQRIQQAQKQGCVGYVICNPHNPVGTILSQEQVKNICEWAKQYPNFHLIFDEMYLNTCRAEQTLTSSSYSIQYPNIHTVRGFAKDFGLCGLKVGVAISSNPKVIQKMQEWQPIYRHHDLTLSVINQMLQRSNYGQDIIQFGKKQLKQYFSIILKQLDDAGIEYTKPVAGCFVFADFRKNMKELSQDEQNLFWKKMFYKYRVNLSNGFYFHAEGPGYFRICPVTQENMMRVGLKRIKGAAQDIQN